MHTHTHSHTSMFGLSWSPANIAFTILVTLLFLIFLFLFLTITALPAFAQAGVPATATQAASMPQFAARLAPQAQRRAMASPAPHPVQPRASSINPRNPRARGQHGWLPDDNTLYDNGPINGNTDGWTINFGFAVSDTFTTNGSQITGLQFGAWLFPGDVLQSAEILIGTAEYGNDLFDQVVSFTQSSNCPINTFGYAICTETATFTANIGAGTPWITLQNAVVNDGDPLYWDENSGPSLASANSVGTIPSEAFSLEGGGPPTDCAHDKPEDGFKIIHNFTGNVGPGGLAIDPAEKLYGAGPGGNNGFGSAYELAPSGQNWIFTPLYNFLGGANGQTPSPGILGPERALYGVADGGILNCDGYYCGVVYRLRPSPVACLTALCSWTGGVIYSFTDILDGAWPIGVVVDPAGNVYGITREGLYGVGSVFELTPSNGGWTKKAIYTFTVGSYGAFPTSLVLGQDGNLYGTTALLSRDGGGGGVIFQLVPSGGSWTEVVIATYDGCNQTYGSCSPILIQERSGNFYGIDNYVVYQCYWWGCAWNTYGRVFVVSPSDGGWRFTVIGDTWEFWSGGNGLEDGYDIFNGVATDAAGNVYATEDTEIYYQQISSAVFKLPQQRLVTFYGHDFGGLEVGSSGKVYGTTGACGGSNGTAWQLTPP